MSRFKLTVAYDGTDFAGWQFQPGQRTVQGVLEQAAGKILGAPVRLHGSGRTDSGVHALGQVAHFDIPNTAPDIHWQKALNAKLPDDVRVHEALPVAAEFHARYHAVSKTYAYSLWLDRQRRLPQRRRYVWVCGPLDLAAMDEGAAFLLGEHDFAAFQNTGTVIISTIRELTAISRSPGPHAEEWVWQVTASGFLRQMVRNIVGCLVAVGGGKIAPETVGTILAGCDRTAAPPSAPPQGLCLEQVEYTKE